MTQVVTALHRISISTWSHDSNDVTTTTTTTTLMNYAASL